MKKTRKNLLNIYCDMDGVIADFNNEPNAVERFATEKGFFKKLHVMNEWGFNQLLARKDEFNKSTKNVVTLVVGILVLVTGIGNFIAWIVDLVTEITSNKISVFAD